MAQRNAFPPAEVPQMSEQLTACDLTHGPLYLYLLDSAAIGCQWQDLPPSIFGFDPKRGPEHTRMLFETNLARARWMTEHGWRLLLKQPSMNVC